MLRLKMLKFRISSLHIHVERVIGLLKNRYTILQGTLPIQVIKSAKDEANYAEFSSIDNIIHVCSALSNIRSSIALYWFLNISVYLLYQCRV